MQINSFSDKMVDKIYKRKFYLIVRIGISVIILLLMIIYFVAPISKVANYDLKGNYYLSRDEIKEIMFLNDDSFVFSVDKKKVDELLDNHPLIKEANVDISLVKMKVDIVELSPTVRDDNNYYVQDGTVLDGSLFSDSSISEKLSSIVSELPYILKDITEYNSSNLDLLLQVSLILKSKLLLDLDYCDFNEVETSGSIKSYFDMFIKVSDLDCDYLRLRFDAYCIKQYYQENKLLDFLENSFNKQLKNFLKRDNLKEYDNLNMPIYGNNLLIKSFYISVNKSDSTIMFNK